MGSFCINALTMGRVATADNLVDKGMVRTEIIEFLAPPHQQGIMNSVLEMAMGAFDRAVPMRDAFVVARRRHSIMGAKLAVSAMRSRGAYPALDCSSGGTVLRPAAQLEEDGWDDSADWRCC